MMKGKNLFQKASLVSGVISFILAMVCGVLLYMRLEVVDKQDPVNASLLASVFFFVFVGIILTIIGRANIPSFKIDASDS